MGMRDIAKRACDVLGIPRYWILDNMGELRMLLVRTYALLPTQRLKIRRLERTPRLNLLFGCGETSYPGWVGIDCVFRDNVGLLLDLRRPLPFSDRTVDYCYSEHLLEHLFPDEGLQHFREVLRILKPRGVYRIVVPDAARFFHRYLEGDGAFFRLAFPWAERPMQAIWHVVNFGGAHRNVLDFDEIKHMASEAGFAEVRRSEANGSCISELRIDRLQPQRVAESLYVELTKPPGVAV
jgi:predicted SAM-dependent methyltransferase